MSSLRDKLEIAKLGLELRSIWHGNKTITVDKVRKSFNLIWTFITGKKLE